MLERTRKCQTWKLFLDPIQYAYDADAGTYSYIGLPGNRAGNPAGEGSWHKIPDQRRG